MSFRTIHIDHKGPFHPYSAGNVHCLLIVDAFSRFLMIYLERNTTALATITAVEKWILSLGILQSIIHDRGTAFINTEFINWTKELGITLRRRTVYSAWTNDNQNNNFCERFMEQRTRDLNNLSTTEEHVSFPFPIEPLRYILSTNKPKQSSINSNDSGITSAFPSSLTPVL